MDSEDIKNNSEIAPSRPIVRSKFFFAIFTLLFLLLIFLVPVTLIPGFPSLFYVSKLGIVLLLGGISTIFLLMHILRTGELEFPQSNIIFALILIPIVAIISSIFSDNQSNSIWGNILEVGTSGSLVIVALLFLLSIIAGSKKARIKKSLVAFLISMGLALLYTGTLICLEYGGIPVTFGLHANLIGSYIDFSILLSVAIIVCIYFLNFGEVSKTIKLLLWILIILSLLVIGATGFLSLNIMLGVAAFLICIYNFTVFRGGKNFWKMKSYSPLIVLIVSVMFIIGSTPFSSYLFRVEFLSGYLSSILKINSFDVRPNSTVTLDMIKQQWGENAIVGTGPNKFVELFALYKPVSLNESPYWNTDFSYGFGFMPTLFATTGLLGLFSFALFLFLFIKKGLSAFFGGEATPAPGNARFMSVFLFLASLFLWVTTFVYVSSIVVLSFTFILSGLFVASLSHIGSIHVARINLRSSSRIYFVSVVLIVLVIMSVVSAEYFVGKKIAAFVLFDKAVAALTSDAGIGEAQNAILVANTIAPSDVYVRSLSELYLLQIEKMMSTIKSDSDITDSQKMELQNAVAQALTYAKQAIQINPKNYQNYVAIARIYESLAAKGIEGAGESATSAYDEASKLNPNNPSIQLGLARIAVFGGDVDSARKYINKALELKKNYTDAYFTLAQLEAARNDVPAVIKAIEGATIADSQNPGLYFQLGLIKYQTGDNAGAVVALERALTIIPDYANAQYFLGLSYHNLKRNNDAINQFENLKKTNPDNKEIALILENLKQGNDLFAGALPPIDSEPEKRSSPPIEE